MVLNLWKKTKVENAIDLETTIVQLPKSKREFSLSRLINEMDEAEEKKKNEEKEPPMAHGEHHVEVGGEKMTVNTLIEKHNALKSELEKVKMKDSEYGEEGDKDPGNDDEMANEDDEGMSNEEDEPKEDKKKLVAKKEDEVAEAKKQNALEKANRLKNANKRALDGVEEAVTFDPFNQVKVGKARYGSGN